jgi:hypothetical protein
VGVAARVVRPVHPSPNPEAAEVSPVRGGITCHGMR